MQWLRTLVRAELRPLHHVSPWPWGAFWVHPDGTVSFDENIITEEVAWGWLDQWLEQEARGRMMVN